jgi:CRP-like cAMP-binding protein
MQLIGNRQLLLDHVRKYNLDEILPDALIEVAELCLYEQGESILTANEVMNYFYFFIGGKLKIFQVHENGRSLLIQFYSQFDSLGEVEFMNDVLTTCSVVAVKDSELIRIPFDSMRLFAKDHPPFLRYVIKSLSTKLIIADQHHSYNLLNPVKNRLSSYLKAHLGEGNCLELMDSFQEISEFIGTTYRQLHRAFQQLEDEGIIVKTHRTIKVSDPEALNKLAGHIYNIL